MFEKASCLHNPKNRITLPGRPSPFLGCTCYTYIKLIFVMLRLENLSFWCLLAVTRHYGANKA